MCSYRRPPGPAYVTTAAPGRKLCSKGCSERASMQRAEHIGHVRLQPVVDIPTPTSCSAKARSCCTARFQQRYRRRSNSTPEIKVVASHNSCWILAATDSCTCRILRSIVEASGLTRVNSCRHSAGARITGQRRI